MSISWFNGNFLSSEEIQISPEDSGFTTGIGVFDSQLAVDGNLVYGEDHFNRLLHDAEIVIRKKPDIDINQFISIAQALLQKNNLIQGRARVRSTITGGVPAHILGPAQKPTVLISVGPAPEIGSLPPINACIIEDYPRMAGCNLENCKRLDYSRSYNARRDAENRGGNEAILTNTNGYIACAATSNIFIEENGKLITPPLSDGVLFGITRQKIIEERRAREESISKERLLGAEAVYLSNSLTGLRAVSSLDGKNIVEADVP